MWVEEWNAAKDDGYVEHIGMGVRNKIIMGMQRRNGTESDFIADDLQLGLCLYREKS